MRGCLQLFGGLLVLLVVVTLVLMFRGGLPEDVTPTPSARIQATEAGATRPPVKIAEPSAPVPTAQYGPIQAGQPAPSPLPTPGSPEADRIVAFRAGPGAKEQYTDPARLLGVPDLVEEPCCMGMLQMGRGGTVVLAFADNSISDGPGADFQVLGESAQDDSILVEASADGETWYAFPVLTENPPPLDLGQIGLQGAVYLRITDVRPGTTTGAELDAVIALNSGPALPLPPIEQPLPTPAPRTVQGHEFGAAILSPQEPHRALFGEALGIGEPDCLAAWVGRSEKEYPGSDLCRTGDRRRATAGREAAQTIFRQPRHHRARSLPERGRARARHHIQEV